MTLKKFQPTTDNSDETYALIKEFRESNNKEAQSKLVERYTNLVESLAKKYSKGRTYHEDMKQVGMLGLLNAINRYDESFGKSFEAFAIPTIIGEIKRFLRDKTWSVHVPRRIKELGPKIKSAVDHLTNELQRSPQVHEIASYLEATEEEILETMEIGKNYNALSVDHSIDADAEGGTVTMLDLIGNNDVGYDSVDQRLLIEKIIHVLNERERQIIKCTFFDDLSQKDTGVLLGISQMHVSRLQRRAITKLRKALKLENNQSECSL